MRGQQPQETCQGTVGQDRFVSQLVQDFACFLVPQRTRSIRPVPVRPRMLFIVMEPVFDHFLEFVPRRKLFGSSSLLLGFVAVIMRHALTSLFLDSMPLTLVGRCASLPTSGGNA